MNENAKKYVSIKKVTAIDKLYIYIWKDPLTIDHLLASMVIRGVATYIVAPHVKPPLVARLGSPTWGYVYS